MPALNPSLLRPTHVPLKGTPAYIPSRRLAGVLPSITKFQPEAPSISPTGGDTSGPASTDSVESMLFGLSTHVKVGWSRLAMHLPEAWKQRIFSQIDLLLDPDEWDDEDPDAFRASSTTMLRFFCSQHGPKAPALSLTPGGHLVSTWKHETDLLHLEYLEDDIVRWATTTFVDGDRVVASGRCPIRALNGLISPPSFVQFIA